MSLFGRFGFGPNEGGRATNMRRIRVHMLVVTLVLALVLLLGAGVAAAASPINCLSIHPKVNSGPDWACQFGDDSTPGPDIKVVTPNGKVIEVPAR